MKPLMNLMNLMKLFWVHYGFSKKNSVIFFVNWYEMRFFGSLKFIRFINLAMRMKKCGFVRQLGQINNYLMNLMNVYVVMVFKRFFESTGCLTSYLMKQLCTQQPFRFIKLKKGGV